MAQHIVNLPCIADTYIDRDNPNNNYGSSSNLIIGERRSGAAYYRRTALMRFDTGDVPSRKKIISAILRIYITDIAVDQGGGTRCELVQSDFIENTATYNNTSEPSLTVANYRELDSISTGQYEEFDALRNNLFRDACAITIRGTGSDGYNPNMTFSSRGTANPPILKVTYEDVPPNAPVPTEPMGTYEDNKSIIRFAWTYNSDVGGIQKGYDLQWSEDQIDWTTISDVTANNYYDMPADSLPAGNIYWRLRTYNEYDEVSDYCAVQSFYAVGAPASPVIDEVQIGTARPFVNWSAFAQQVYQLQVLSGDKVIYDSGIVPGMSARQHKVKAWLADGDYTVRIRIKNEYDIWSDWGITEVTISTVKPDKPSLILQGSTYGIDVNATGIVYRAEYDSDEYICIGEAFGLYHDNAVASGKEYKYYVRAVSENDTFKDSDVKFAQVNLIGSLISPVSDLTNVFVFLNSLNSPPKRTYNSQSGGAFVEYAGRTHPVWEPTEHINAGWSMTYFIDAWDKVKAFIAIYDLNGTVIYRDSKGRKTYGTLSNLTINDDILGYIISFTLNQVDYIEEVEAKCLTSQ